MAKSTALFAAQADLFLYPLIVTAFLLWTFLPDFFAKQMIIPLRG
jgi:hypothetical protein